MSQISDQTRNVSNERLSKDSWEQKIASDLQHFNSHWFLEFSLGFAEYLTERQFLFHSISSHPPCLYSFSLFLLSSFLLFIRLSLPFSISVFLSLFFLLRIQIYNFNFHKKFQKCFFAEKIFKSIVFKKTWYLKLQSVDFLGNLTLQ